MLRIRSQVSLCDQWPPLESRQLLLTMMCVLDGDRCEIDEVVVMEDVVEAAGDSRSANLKGHDSGAGVAAPR
jgi:hypothetical protein